MKLTNRHKEIIKLINEGEIEDLQSFIDYYYKSCKKKIDKDEINTKKKIDYENIKDKIDEYADRFLGQKYITMNGYMSETIEHTITSEEIEELKMELRTYSPKYKDFDIVIGAEKVYNILDKEIYLIEDYKAFEDFYFVWTYLLKEEYIVVDEVDNKADYAQYFFKEKVENQNMINEQPIISKYLESISKIDLSALRMFNPMNYRYGYKSNDIDYLDYKLSFNSEEHRRYSVLFNKKIITLPSLKWFAERNFVDVQEYTFKKSLNTTYLALIITIIFSSVSLYFSVVSSKSSTEFWKQNEQSEAITQEHVNTLLEKLVESNQEQAKLMSNLNDLMKTDSEEKLSDFEVALINFLDKNEDKNNEIIELIKQIKSNITENDNQ